MLVFLISLSQPQPDLRNRSLKIPLFLLTDGFGKLRDRSTHCACVQVDVVSRAAALLSILPAVHVWDCIRVSHPVGYQCTGSFRLTTWSLEGNVVGEW
jgi:hypothetical protein